MVGCLSWCVLLCFLLERALCACPSHCGNDGCDDHTWICKSCRDGYYSDYCNHYCPTHCLDQKCDQKTGNCLACDPGYFGEGCHRKCCSRCANQACDFKTGRCEMSATNKETPFEWLYLLFLVIPLFLLFLFAYILCYGKIEMEKPKAEDRQAEDTAVLESQKDK